MRRYTSFLLPLYVAFVSFACAIVPAAAHPHVWVEARSTLVYNSENKPVAIQHAWTFDEAFSAFATDGLDTNKDGMFSREELADLATTNVTSLAEFGFFTFIQSGGKDFSVAQPRDYWLDYDGKALTLHFTLDIARTFDAATPPLTLEVYDPTYFVAFAWKGTDAVTLKDAPQACIAKIDAPPANTTGQEQAQALSEEFFDNLTGEEQVGAQFSNVVAVGCSPEALAQAKKDRVAQTAPSFAEPAENAVPAPIEEPQPEKNNQRLTQSAPADTGAAQPVQRTCQMGAFGIIRPDGVITSQTGILGWIAQQQARFYQAASGTVGKDREAFSWFLLIGMGFLYGAFHAAGPGHGKAVISSYLFATGESLRRGIALAFISAFLQSAVAVALVGSVRLILGASSRTMGQAAFWMEILSYAVIALLGAWLLVRTVRQMGKIYAPQTHDHHHHNHAHHHEHDADCGCGHSHAPDPKALEGKDFSLGKAVSAVLAVGIRPCTGAILILVLAFSQGLYGAGIAATFAMGLGTAITVSLIAALAVYAKNFASRLSQVSQNGKLYIHLLELVAGGVIFLFGALFFLSSMQNGLPVNC